MNKTLFLFASFLWVFVPVSQAQVTTFPYQNPKVQFFDSNGLPCAGCLLNTYIAGTTTAQATYSDNGVTQNANPVVLDSAGRATIYLTSASYKFVLTTSLGVTIWTQDNVTAANLSSTVASLVSNGTVQVIPSTAATSGANQSGPNTQFCGNFWNGASSAADCWTFQDVLGTGTNPTSTLTVSHSGSSGTTGLNFGSQPLTAGAGTFSGAANQTVIIKSNSGAVLSPIVPFNIGDYCGSSTNYVTTFTLNGYQPCSEKSFFFGAPQTGAGFGTFADRVDLITKASTDVQSAVAMGAFATCHGTNSGGTATDNNTNCLAQVANASGDGSVNPIALDAIGQSTYVGSGSHTVQANQSLVNCARTPGWFGDTSNDYCTVQTNLVQSGSQNISSYFGTGSSSTGKGALIGEFVADTINAGHQTQHGPQTTPTYGYVNSSSSRAGFYAGAELLFTTNSVNQATYSADTPSYSFVSGEKAANSGQSGVTAWDSTPAGSSATIAASPTGATESGSVITITTTAPHGFTAPNATGPTMVAHITGVGVSGYNIDCPILSVTSTTFTCNDSNLGLAGSGAGTVTASNIQRWTEYSTSDGNRHWGFASPQNGNGTDKFLFGSNGNFLLNGGGCIFMGSGSDTAISRNAAADGGIGTTCGNFSGIWRAAQAVFTTSTNSATYLTATNCSSSASPAVCGSASAGSAVVAAGATTVVVNTSAVTANSQIMLTFDSSLGTKLSATCNTTFGSLWVSARTAATSFTVTISAAPTTNPACFSYEIKN